jgi:hypothetical protein
MSPKPDRTAQAKENPSRPPLSQGLAKVFAVLSWRRQRVNVPPIEEMGRAKLVHLETLTEGIVDRRGRVRMIFDRVASVFSTLFRGTLLLPLHHFAFCTSGYETVGTAFGVHGLYRLIAVAL